jgi:hypothetical protein
MLSRGGVVKTNFCMKAAGFTAGAVLFSFSVVFPADAAKAKQPAAGTPTAYASSKAPVTVEDPTSTSSIKPAAADASCQKSRKRLFVEGEGWLVRSVTTCF